MDNLICCILFMVCVSGNKCWMDKEVNLHEMNRDRLKWDGVEQKRCNICEIERDRLAFYFSSD